MVKHFPVPARFGSPAIRIGTGLAGLPDRSFPDHGKRSDG